MLTMTSPATLLATVKPVMMRVDSKMLPSLGLTSKLIKRRNQSEI